MYKLRLAIEEGILEILRVVFDEAAVGTQFYAEIAERFEGQPGVVGFLVILGHFLVEEDAGGDPARLGCLSEPVAVGEIIRFAEGSDSRLPACHEVPAGGTELGSHTEGTGLGHKPGHDGIGLGGVIEPRAAR